MTIGDWIQVGMLVVSVVAVMATIVITQKSIKQSIKLTERQISAQIFSEYTRRYNEIIQILLPTEGYDGEMREGDETHLRLYFNLCSEEYHLRKRKMIDKDIWKIWRDGMRSNMKNCFVSLGWEYLKERYDEDFRGYFDDKVVNWEAPK